MAQFLKKCTKLPQMTLTGSRSKIRTCMLHTPPRPKFSSVLRQAIFELRPIFGKVHWMTPNDLDMFKVKIPTLMVHTHSKPIFVSFAVRYAVFELRPIFWKVHWMTPNDLDIFQVKNTIIHGTYTPETKFSSLSLSDEPFLSYDPIFWKVHWMTPNDLDMFKVKNTNMHVTYTPGAQIFIHFTLWWAVFELRPNFRKSAPNDPKSPWDVQGQKY